jgi:hypothetical protein
MASRKTLCHFLTDENEAKTQLELHHVYFFRYICPIVLRKSQKTNLIRNANAHFLFSSAL